MFEEYVEALNREMPLGKRKPEPKFEMDLSTNVLTSPDMLSIQLSDIQNMDNDSLYALLCKTWYLILDKDFIRKNKSIVANVFTNEKFVVLFSRVMNQVTGLNREQQICCNKLVYDYLTLRSEKDPHIESLLYNLGITINRDIIPGLMSLGLDTNTVAYLAIARYSTEKEQLAVKRVNVIIVNSSIEVMTEQMIVKIYEKLFDHLSPLFEGIMLDKWDDEFFQEAEDREEIYGLINLAVLDILNEMPDTLIYNVLYQYKQVKDQLYSKQPVRFDIHAISESDYGRILAQIDRFESTGELIPSR